MRRVALLAAGLVLLTGCGLPLVNGVQAPDKVRSAQQQRSDIQVLPPGPRDDNTPEQVVRGFFGAQSNPDDAHASARAFLSASRRASWRDNGPVDVFDSGLRTTAVADRPDLFAVTVTRVGRIEKDGSYSQERGDFTVNVELVRNAQRRWEIVDVPDGLLLSTADRDRSFLWRSVYFLAPTPTPAGGAATSAAARAHVVPDPVFIPVDADPAQALVQHLLAGPTSALGDSVRTAVPRGAHLVQPVATDAAGVVTVDLSGEVAKLPDAQKEQLSAQLIWTLRGVDARFSKLRLRSNGKPVLIPTSGVNEPEQDRDDWASYDPEGLSSRVTALYVQGRRLRSLSADTPAGPLGDRGAQPVDVAAVAVHGGAFGLLTREAARTVLRTGPPGGPFVRRWASPTLASPSWGSGEQGLWFVDGGRVMVDPGAGASPPPAGVAPHPVPVDGVGSYGAVRALRVSRDGARIALIAGPNGRQVLLVGRIRTVGGRLRVADLRAVAPEVHGVRDVAWSSDTSLVALGQVQALSAPLPVRVTVDGSSVAPIIRVGLDFSVAQTVAAAPDRPLVLGAVSNGSGVLFRDNGSQYVRDRPGVEPFYPG